MSSIAFNLCSAKRFLRNNHQSKNYKFFVCFAFAQIVHRVYYEKQDTWNAYDERLTTFDQKYLLHLDQTYLFTVLMVLKHYKQKATIATWNSRLNTL